MIGKDDNTMSSSPRTKSLSNVSTSLMRAVIGLSMYDNDPSNPSEIFSSSNSNILVKDEESDVALELELAEPAAADSNHDNAQSQQHLGTINNNKNKSSGATDHARRQDKNPTAKRSRLERNSGLQTEASSCDFRVDTDEENAKDSTMVDNDDDMSNATGQSNSNIDNVAPAQILAVLMVMCFALILVLPIVLSQQNNDEEVIGVDDDVTAAANATFNTSHV